MRSFVEADEPSKHVVAGTPRILIRLPGRAEGIELLVPLTGAPPAIPPLAEVHVDVTKDEGADWLRLRTAVPALFPLLYEFALVVADRAQEDGVPVDTALIEAVAAWRRLLQTAAMLSVERQTGLYGELLLLRRLETHFGPKVALDAWTGPTRQAHDFRIGDTEVEVKTTRGERRIHTFGSTKQLEPSPGARLFVASFQITSAGSGGESLAQLIGDLRERFHSHGLGDHYSTLIEEGCLIPPVMEHHYSEQLKLRTPIVLVPADANLPRITDDDIAQIQRPDMSRVTDVRFRLNLEGLGFIDGSDDFLAVLPLGASDGE